MTRRKTDIAPKAQPPPDPAALDAAQAQVVAWMIDGNSEHAISQNLRQHFPGLDPAAIINRVFSHFVDAATLIVINEDGSENNSRLVAHYGLAIDMQRELIRRMTETGDFAAASAAVMKLVNLADRAATLN